jgi:hypothetical protein
VVIHTLIGSAATTIQHWHGGQDCYPPHYVINKSGEITQMVAEYYYAQHAGTANTYSIGIEHEGGCYNTPGCFSESLYQASAALVRDICERQKIPKDRKHIIGHDEVPSRPGEEHGDPGGYWDWEYYMALLQWDGRTASQKPQRIVLDYNSLFTFPLTANWNEGTRKWVKWGPGHEQSYAGKYYFAKADAAAKDDDAVRYTGIITDSGAWTLSAWWPVLAGNNSAAHISVATNNRDPAQRSFSADYDQSARAHGAAHGSAAVNAYVDGSPHVRAERWRQCQYRGFTAQQQARPNRRRRIPVAKGLMAAEEIRCTSARRKPTASRATRWPALVKAAR